MKKTKPITSLPSNYMYVFSSNLLGMHTNGTAQHAMKHFGARLGEAEGPQGQSYAIPTKDEEFNSLPLFLIAKAVERFLSYAYAHPSTIFYVSPMGTNSSEYTLAEFDALFSIKTENVRLSWKLPTE